MRQVKYCSLRNLVGAAWPINAAGVLVVKSMDSGIVVSSNSSRAITSTFGKIIIIIIIIIIISRHHHGYPWPSFDTPPYRLLLPTDLQGYNPYRHRAAVCRFELVFLLLLGHEKGSITYELVPTSPAFYCISGSSNFESFRDGWWQYSCCLWSAVSRTCSALLAEFLCSCLQAFSSFILLASM